MSDLPLGLDTPEDACSAFGRRATEFSSSSKAARAALDAFVVVPRAREC